MTVRFLHMRSFDQVVTAQKVYLLDIVVRGISVVEFVRPPRKGSLAYVRGIHIYYIIYGLWLFLGHMVS